jgi:hypothetical protein
VGSHHRAIGAFLFCASSPTDQVAAITAMMKSRLVLACSI